MNEYRKNVTIVLNFLKERGYAQSTVKNHERFYTLLADDLAAKDITYSPEYGKALLSTLPVPAWLPKSRIENAACISKLDDAYIHGCIINAQASPRKSYSKLSLNSNFENHITRFLRSRENVFTESQIANVKRRCSLFLKCMQSKGRMDPSEITYGDIDSYHEELAHLKRISRVIEESTLHQFLQFLAESGKVPYGLYLRIYALETECFVNLDDFPPDEQSRLIKNSSEGQVRLSPERFLSEGLELIRLHQEAGYVQKYTEASKRAILQLYLFLDYHNLWYDPDMADIWLHSDCVKKRLFKGCSWNTARHILFMFSDYVTSGSVHFEKKLPRGINGINNIPEWCLTPLLDFAESRRKMKLDENTVKNDIYSILRFCRFIIGEGLSSYGDINGSHLADFNLADHHGTPEGKNACNNRVKRFLKYLYRKGLNANPSLYMALGCSAAPVETVVVVLTSSEIEEIKTFVGNAYTDLEIRDSAVIMLGLEMGMRSSDIANLKLENIDWKNRSILYRQNKTDTDVWVPMPVAVGNAIFRYLKQSRPRMAVCRNVFVDFKAPFCGMSRNICYGALKRALPDRDVRGSGFHVTRKTFSTNRLRNGVRPESIADVIGHRDTESLKHYLSLDDERMAACPLSLADLRLEMEGSDAL